MKKFKIISILIILLTILVDTASATQITVAWIYRDISTKIEIYEIKGYPRLWDTRVVNNFSELPVYNKLEMGAFGLNPGFKKRFVLVMHNNTDVPLYFFAAPHQASPVEHSLGFKFKCLCVNHAFSVGPNEIWYRVVELQLAEGFVGDALTITHSIIGIDSARAKGFSQTNKVPDL